MRWLRENWLDFLIFLLIALVAAGIVLYLTGINPFARPQVSVPPQEPPAPQASPPAPLPVAPSPPSPQEKAPEPVVTVIPLPQAPAEPLPPQRKEPSPEASEAKPSAQAASPAPVPSSTGTFRVVVGAFANPENAARLRTELAQKGYSARLEAAGGLTRVVVGPYASEAEARKVAQALAVYGAQVYRGQGARVAEGTLYLQVGAFQKEENALVLASKLREAGLPVVLVKDGVFRVRIGPVPEGEKEAVKAKVEAFGLEALEVR